MTGKKALIVLAAALSLLLSGCSSSAPKIPDRETGTVAETETQAPVPKLYLDFSVDGDADLPGHSVKVCLDGKEIATLSDPHYYTQLLEAEEGEHSISVMLDGTPAGDPKSFTIKGDMSVKGAITYRDGTLLLSEIETVDSIADSAITYQDVTGLPLDEALDGLISQHFVNVQGEPEYAGDVIMDPADWEVVAQNIADGAVIDKAEPIRLTCRKVFFQLYLDLGFDENILLAKYDLDIYLDGLMLDTMPHGKTYTKLNRVSVGDHRIEVRKSSDNKITAVKEFRVTGDSTFKARLHTNKDDIEINDSQLLDSIEGASLEVPDVVGLSLSVAFEDLAGIGFSNVREEPYSEIWDKNNWTVISQDIEPGTVMDKNNRIILSCVKTSDYVSGHYVGLTVAEAEKKVSDNKDYVQFYDYLSGADITNSAASMTDDEKKMWLAQSVRTEAGMVKLYLVYTGAVEMPDLVGKNLAVALEEMRSRKYSSVVFIAADGTTILNTANWTVVAQSIEPGSQVNANGTITLTAEKNK